MANSREFLENYKRIEPALCRPFIIAEAGVNHEGKMDNAKRLVDEAAEGGAQAIKFQSYKAETLASKNSPAYWDTTKESTLSQYELFKKHDSFWKKEFVELKEYCDKVGIEFISTPFDIESATYLNDLVTSYKISSSDITNFPFIDYIARFGKPIFLSTGASYIWEIQQAVDIMEARGCPNCLLHCILNYPTPDENANLGMITDLKKRFPDSVIGYSDHTLPKEMEMLKMAFLLGAVVIEKHFTFDKTLPGNDHYHAMDVHDLKNFQKLMDETFAYLGSFQKVSIEAEEISRRNARRSLVAATDIPAGTTLEPTMVTWKRPAFGISVKHHDEVIGLVTKTAIAKDDIFYWSLLEGK